MLHATRALWHLSYSLSYYLRVFLCLHICVHMCGGHAILPVLLNFSVGSLTGVHHLSYTKSLGFSRLSLLSARLTGVTTASGFSQGCQDPDSGSHACVWEAGTLLFIFAAHWVVCLFVLGFYLVLDLTLNLFLACRQGGMPGARRGILPFPSSELEVQVVVLGTQLWSLVGAASTL